MPLLPGNSNPLFGVVWIFPGTEQIGENVKNDVND